MHTNNIYRNIVLVLPKVSDYARPGTLWAVSIPIIELTGEVSIKYVMRHKLAFTIYFSTC